MQQLKEEMDEKSANGVQQFSTKTTTKMPIIANNLVGFYYNIDICSNPMLVFGLDGGRGARIDGMDTAQNE